MTLFVDTSALYALLDRDDAENGVAAGFFGELSAEADLVTHNYVLVETLALVQARLGADAVHGFVTDLLPRLRVEWVDREHHALALAALVASRSKAVSFVDRVSFELMRMSEMDTAFAFDSDFETEGFAVVPGPSA